MGVQKTGSTALHHFVQRNQAALPMRVLTPEKGTPVRRMGRLAAQFTLDEGKRDDFVAAIRTVRDVLDAGQGPVLISHENLVGAMPGRAGTVALYPRIGEVVALLDEHLAPHVPVYAVYSRDMGPWKRSVHNQAVKTDSYPRPLADFLAETEDCGTWDDLAARLERAAPGRAHVFALEDEPDRTRPGAQLLRLCGMSADEIAALDPVPGKRNESLNTGALEFMRLINMAGLTPPARTKVAQLVARNQSLFAPSL
jgi:hypothetical protein